MVAPSTPIMGHPEHLHPQEMQFDTIFLQTRNSSSSQQPILNFDEVPSEVSLGTDSIILPI